MRVFVAGATGVLGRRLVPLLVRDGHAVAGLTRDPAKEESLRRLGAEPVVCDALNPAELTAAVAAQRPEVVVHELTDLPASLNPRRLAQHYAANNRVRREGTANLLAAATAAGVRRIVAQSTAFWYRRDGGLVKTENDPLDTEAPAPIGEAVRTMARVERDLLTAAGIEAVILRYGVFYGPGTWYAPDGDIGRQVARRVFPVIGRGAGVTSFVHVDDAAAATAAALTAPPGVYNIVDDEPARAADWLPALAAALGAKSPRRVPTGVPRLLLGPALVDWMSTQRGAANAKAKRELRWRPRYPSWRTGFAEGLRS